MDWKIPEGAVRFYTADTIEESVSQIRDAGAISGAFVECGEIGRSVEGRPIWGIRVGDGPRRVSLIAGAHADEPIGPMTALALARWLSSDGGGKALADEFSFFICPHVNPDGAERNRKWLSDPLDPVTYLKGTLREPPGEDIEFGYPRREGAFEFEGKTLGPLGPLRPENAVVAEFLGASAPFAYHASLHGMAFCEGAWFLIGRDWAERTGALRRRLTAHCARLGVGHYDIDRRGEKGFFRIAHGYSTTPTHLGMRKFFLEAGDPETADLFHPNSMEWIGALGGEPLVMVSELPLFRICVPYEWDEPPGPDTPSAQMRERMPEARLALESGDEGPLRELLNEFEVRATPLAVQVELQGLMVLEALEFLRGAH